MNFDAEPVSNLIGVNEVWLYELNDDGDDDDADCDVIKTDKSCSTDGFSSTTFNVSHLMTFDSLSSFDKSLFWFCVSLAIDGSWESGRIDLVYIFEIMNHHWVDETHDEIHTENGSGNGSKPDILILFWY